MIRLLAPLCVTLMLLGCAETESTSPAVVERTSPTEMGAEPQVMPETPGARISGAPISASDSGFLREAAIDGLREVRMGELAAERGTNKDIREFGEQLVSDHRKTNKEIIRLGERKGVTVPQRLELSDRKDLDRYATMSGPDFDRAWLKQIIEDHRNDIDKFQREAQEAQDPDARAFASQTLPALQDHLRRAEEIQQSLEQEP